MPDDLKASEILNKAADLIEPEGAWAQEYFARDEHGNFVEACDELAMCWCVLGAIEFAAGGVGVAYSEAQHCLGAIVGEQIDEWNDAPRRTQAEVVAALRQAAKLAEEEGN